MATREHISYGKARLAQSEWWRRGWMDDLVSAKIPLEHKLRMRVHTAGTHGWHTRLAR